ncbi:MAG TPA: sugar kinase [Microbacterium sp.]|nr:sugar kinase [Microbacterium sp.]
MTGLVLTLGESMGLVRAVEPGRLELVSTMTLGFGGAESNVAIALARLGVPVRWVGRVGADGVGRRIARELRAEGVDVVALEQHDAPTALMLKNTVAGMTVVSYYRKGSAGSMLDPSDVERLDLSGVALVHVTGITLAISESARQATRRLVVRAREAGGLVSFDVNHRSALWAADVAAAQYRELVADVDIVFAGADEAELVLGAREEPARLARGLRALGPREVVVKLGEAGCHALSAESTVDQAAYSVNVVDTVGAGDAFVAGYLAELLAGSPLETRARTAVLAGAMACTSPGDWEGAASARELEELATRGADPVKR